MTKPEKIAAGIGVAGAVCGVVAVAGTGLTRGAFTWITLACAGACTAYVANRPTWLGKRDGRLTWRALPLLPYLVALHIACWLMRWWRGHDAPAEVAPGIWVAGRIAAADVPPGATAVVDLVAEYSEPRAIRELAAYRSLPVLDGGVPDDALAFLALIEELADSPGPILIHCDSGRGRAPTLAAAVLVARGLANGIPEAVARLRTRRPVAAPTRSDLRFLADLLPSLRQLAAVRGGRAAAQAGAAEAR